MIATHNCDEAAAASDAKERLNEDILRILMDAKKIRSIAELARRSQVSKSTIFRLRAGEVNTSVHVAKRLSQALDTTVETLFAKAGRQS